MTLFSRMKPDPRPFWEVPPFDSNDVAVLYRHGISCVGHGDAKGMMSTGWAIWNLDGLEGHQAKDFLLDGYRDWVAAGATVFERTEFLLGILHRLRDIHPEIAVDADVWSLPRHVAETASSYYSARCWAGSELLEITARSGTPEPSLEDEVFRGFTQTHPAFMPPRTIEQYRGLLKRRGLADPWE
jgi:hypothetical protein